MPIEIAIIGGSSYVAGELLRLLLNHPEARVNFIESEHSAGQPIFQAHPFLAQLTDLKFSPFDARRIKDTCQFAFIAKSHGSAMGFAGELLPEGVKVIDLSADFRLRDPENYARWYNVKHSCPELLKEAVYGLPELNLGRIRDARLVANPGCYPTAAILGIAPLLSDRIAQPQGIIINACSGISGAGRTPQPGKNMFLDAYGNLKPYKANSHPHIPEIEQELSHLCQGEARINFIPYLVPLDKGIYCTSYLKLQRPVELGKLVSYYRNFYRNAPFVRIYDPGIYPEISNVAGTNFCDIGLAMDPKSQLVVAFSAIDNTMKGASGQAVQNLNLMSGLPQGMGLPVGIQC